MPTPTALALVGISPIALCSIAAIGNPRAARLLPRAFIPLILLIAPVVEAAVPELIAPDALDPLAGPGTLLAVALTVVWLWRAGAAPRAAR